MSATDFLFAVFMASQRLFLLPYSNFKKNNYTVRQKLLHNVTYRSKQTLSSKLSVIPTATCLPIENGLIYCSAIVGRDISGTFQPDFHTQLSLVLFNLTQALDRVKSCPDYMLKVTVHLTDRNHIELFLQKYNAIFTSNTPFEATSTYVPTDILDNNGNNDGNGDNNTNLASASSPTSHTTTTTTTTTDHTTTPLDSTPSQTSYYQNQPRPALTVIIVNGFFNKDCLIQIDTIAATKIISDPTISIDSHEAPLWLDEETEMNKYREYVLQKWDNSYNNSVLDELDILDKSEHPAIYHAKLQIRLDLQKQQIVEMNQKAMIKCITTVNAAILENFPSVHATIHIPTGYTYISGVNGILPLLRYGHNVYDDDGDDGDGDSENHNYQDNDELQRNSKSKKTTISIDIIPSISPQTTQERPPRPYPYMPGHEPSTSTSTKYLPLMPNSPFSSNFDPITMFSSKGISFGKSTEHYDDENDENDEYIDHKHDKNNDDNIVQNTFSVPTPLDQSLIKLIFKDRIDDDVTHYFRSFKMTPDTVEHNVSQVLDIMQTTAVFNTNNNDDDNNINFLFTNNDLENDHQISPQDSTPPSQTHSYLNEIDPQIWLFRYQLVFHEYCHVFAQTRQSIFNLINIILASNINLFTGITKLTIYTTSVRYLPYIKYAFQLYWPHHPLNGKPTELMALSIIPVPSLLHDNCLVEFDVVAVQHDINKPFLFKHTFNPQKYYTALNNVIWHSVFYLLYPDESNPNIALLPLHRSDIVNKLAKGQYESEEQHKLTLLKQETEFAKLQVAEYYYAQLATQSHSTDIIPNERIYTPYYNKPLIIYEKQIEKKLESNPKYQEHKAKQHARLTAKTPEEIEDQLLSDYDPYHDVNLTATLMDHEHVHALIEKKSLKLNLTELQYKHQTETAYASRYVVVPRNYEERLRMYHLTMAMYPTAATKPPQSSIFNFGQLTGNSFGSNVNDNNLFHKNQNEMNNFFPNNHILGHKFTHSSWLTSLFQPISSFIYGDGVDNNKINSEQNEDDGENDINTQYKNLLDLKLARPISLYTVSSYVHPYSSIFHQISSSLSSITSSSRAPHSALSASIVGTRQYYTHNERLHEKWYNYKYDGQYYQPQQKYFTKEQLLSLLQRQYNLELASIRSLLSQMVENEIEISAVVGNAGVSAPSSSIHIDTNDDNKNQKTLSKNKKDKKGSSNNYLDDDDFDDTYLDPTPTVTECINATHTSLYAHQYGFPCAPFVTVAIEDKLKYCIKYGSYISDSVINGLITGRRGYTPGSVYSSAFIGNDYVHLYGSIFKMLRMMKQQHCQLVKITIIIADNNNMNQHKRWKFNQQVNAGIMEHNNIDDNDNNEEQYDEDENIIDSSSQQKKSPPRRKEEPTRLSYIPGDVMRWLNPTANSFNLVHKSNIDLTSNIANTSSNTSSTTSSNPYGIITRPKFPSSWQTSQCLQFLRCFQAFLGSRIPYSRNPKFYDKVRMFADFRRKQRPVVTTYHVNELPNNAKYHIEVVGVYR